MGWLSDLADKVTRPVGVADPAAANIHEPTREAVDHELARMNEERDQRWAAQDRKDMGITENSATRDLCPDTFPADTPSHDVGGRSL
jgi:hypothetical protein